jgi:hypothetical protein
MPCRGPLRPRPVGRAAQPPRLGVPGTGSITLLKACANIAAEKMRRRAMCPSPPRQGRAAHGSEARRRCRDRPDACPRPFSMSPRSHRRATRDARPARGKSPRSPARALCRMGHVGCGHRDEPVSGSIAHCLVRIFPDRVPEGRRPPPDRRTTPVRPPVATAPPEHRVRPCRSPRGSRQGSRPSPSR